MEIRNAKIISTMLGIEDHGIMTCFITLDYGSASQGFGGYSLDEPKHDENKKFIGRFGSAYGMQFVMEILKVVGVEKWEDLKGKYVRAEYDMSKIKRIGNIIEDRWFDPKDMEVL